MPRGFVGKRPNARFILPGSRSYTYRPLIPHGHIVHDDFNRPDGELGEAATGQPWTVLAQPPSTLGIVGTQAQGQGVDVAAVLHCGVTDFEMWMTLKIVNANVTSALVFDWNTNFSGPCGMLRHRPRLSTYHLIVLRRDGEPITIGLPGAPPKAGDVLRLRRRGTLYAAFLNDTTIGSYDLASQYTPVTPNDVVGFRLTSLTSAPIAGAIDDFMVAP